MGKPYTWSWDTHQTIRQLVEDEGHLSSNLRVWVLWSAQLWDGGSPGGSICAGSLHWFLPLPSSHWCLQSMTRQWCAFVSLSSGFPLALHKFMQILERVLCDGLGGLPWFFPMDSRAEMRPMEFALQYGFCLWTEMMLLYCMFLCSLLLVVWQSADGWQSNLL
ncbi:hypothetical protein U1Q18_013256 [Sarracenia purpurea var. burkii]